MSGITPAFERSAEMFRINTHYGGETVVIGNSRMAKNTGSPGSGAGARSTHSSTHITNDPQTGG